MWNYIAVVSCFCGLASCQVFSNADALSPRDSFYLSLLYQSTLQYGKINRDKTAEAASHRVVPNPKPEAVFMPDPFDNVLVTNTEFPDLFPSGTFPPLPPTRPPLGYVVPPEIPDISELDGFDELPLPQLPDGNGQLPPLPPPPGVTAARTASPIDRNELVNPFAAIATRRPRL